jgi:hypothetical protein
MPIRGARNTENEENAERRVEALLTSCQGLYGVQYEETNIINKPTGISMQQRR